MGLTQNFVRKKEQNDQLNRNIKRQLNRNSKFEANRLNGVSTETRGRKQRPGFKNLNPFSMDVSKVSGALNRYKASEGQQTINKPGRGVKPRTRRRTAAEILASRRPRTPPVLARLLEEIREANRRANR